MNFRYLFLTLFFFSSILIFAQEGNKSEIVKKANKRDSLLNIINNRSSVVDTVKINAMNDYAQFIVADSSKKALRIVTHAPATVAWPEP